MKISILHPTRHDGKRLQPGDTVDIERGAATALISADVAEAFDPKAAAKAKADADAAAKAVADADAAAKAVADADAAAKAVADADAAPGQAGAPGASDQPET